MNEQLQLSTQKLKFELIGNQTKDQKRIQIRNMDNKKAISINMKITQKNWFIVIPYSAIINPLEIIDIDITFVLRKDEILKKLKNYFCIYYLEIKDKNITWHNIKKYTYNHENEIKKIYIKSYVDFQQSNYFKKSVQRSQEKHAQSLKQSQSSFLNSQMLKKSIYLNKQIQKSIVWQSQERHSMLISGIGQKRNSVLIKKKNLINSDKKPKTEMKETRKKSLFQQQKEEILQIQKQPKEKMLDNLKNEEKDLKLQLNQMLREIQSKKNNIKYLEKEEKLSFWKYLLLTFVGVIVGTLVNSS